MDKVTFKLYLSLMKVDDCMENSSLDVMRVKNKSCSVCFEIVLCSCIIFIGLHGSSSCFWCFVVLYCIQMMLYAYCAYSFLHLITFLMTDSSEKMTVSY